VKPNLKGKLSHLKPHMVDPWVFAIVAASFGLGVWIVAWHGTSLRLEVEGANLTWVALVGFGMAWHGEWGSGWRVGAGLVAGGAASVAAYYGALTILPLTPFSFGMGLGISAACVALIAHMYPRVLSFAGAAVGFAVGISAARALPMRPLTPADDLFALMLTVSLALVMGVTGSLALRAVVLRMGREQGGAPTHVRFIPHLLHREDRAPTTEIESVAVRSKPRQKMGAGR
jgi:hypothetical protein